MIIRYALTLLLLTSWAILDAQEAENTAQIQTPKSELPNPHRLTSDWWDYYKVENGILKKRIEKTEAYLSQIKKQIEENEKQQEAETLLKEIRSNFNSYLVLKEHVVETTPPTWLPKKAYTLEDYLNLVDRQYALEQQISFATSEWENRNFLASELNQDNRALYSDYLKMDDPSTDKLLAGLKLIASDIRYHYLLEEKRLAKEKVKHLKTQLEKVNEELAYAEESIQFSESDLAAFEEKLQKLRREDRLAHLELLTLEAKSVQSYKEEESLTLVNQNLLNALAKETLINVKKVLYESLIALEQSISQNTPESLIQKITALENIQEKIENQLRAWNRVTSIEINQASLGFSQQSDQKNSKELLESFEKRIHVALESRMLFEEIKKELHRVDAVAALMTDTLITQKPPMNQFFFWIQAVVSSTLDSLAKILSIHLFDLAGVPITLLGLLHACFILFMTFVVSRILQRLLRRLSKKKTRVDEATFYILSRILHYAILTLGLIIALSSLGLTLGNLAIVIGALGIGIGLGLQTIVNNFVCGLIILFEREIKVGDFIELDTGQFGKVVDINIQNTTIHTFDGVDLLVPNSNLMANKVINWTKEDPYQRLHIPFCVAYGNDQDRVCEVVIERALSLPYTIKNIPSIPAPEVWLVQFGESSLNFELIVWVNIRKSGSRSSLKASYLGEIEKALRENGITIPFPQRDLYIKSLPEEMSSYVRSKTQNKTM